MEEKEEIPIERRRHADKLDDKIKQLERQCRQMKWTAIIYAIGASVAVVLFFHFFSKGN
jgi:hypothetical protein